MAVQTTRTLPAQFVEDLGKEDEKTIKPIIKQLKKNRTLTFKVTNLLDDDRESKFIGFNEEEEYFSFRHIGRTFSFSYAVRF